MKRIYDALAKEILQALLRDVAQLEISREIRGHVLTADVWVEPDPERTAGLEALGALGRMVAEGPCLIEPYSGVPRASEIRSCILKQYALDHAQRRDARTGGTSTPPFPGLWIITSGSPDSIIGAMELRPMPGWPEGFLTGRPFDPLRLVVVRKLPRTPETLLLRLLGRDRAFRDALDDLAGVPEQGSAMTAIADLVLRVLVVFRGELDQDQLEEDDMEALRDIDAKYEEWKQRVRGEGMAQGIEQGRREALLEAIEAVCRQLHLDLDEQQRHELRSMDADALQDRLVAISTSRNWPG